jgi:hypothetical protein
MQVEKRLEHRTAIHRCPVLYLSAAPGPIRWHYRQKINALVYQAIIE